MITGIYKITNKTNNKVYIGSAIDIKKRWRDHKWHLKENKHHNSHLQASYNKHGLNEFEFTIEVECSIGDLLNEEKRIIKLYNAYNNKCGYNINDPKKIYRGRKTNDEIIQLLSKRMLGEKNPMFNKLGVNHPKHEYKLSTDSKKNISIKMSKRIGSKANASKLHENEIKEIINLYNNTKISQTNLAKMFNVTQATISNILNKKNWSHI